jgi:hypothetical protein
LAFKLASLDIENRLGRAQYGSRELEFRDFEF